MSTRLVSLELDNFRGFGQPQTLELDADVILVRGDNGSGKTSLTDGILWLLTGNLRHLTERVKGLRQTHDPIQNRYGQGRPSRVALTLRNEEGTWVFERVGDSRATTLTASRDGQVLRGDDWLHRAFGEESAAELQTAVSTWGILRQDAVRSVLDTGGAALHERMSAVIGLADVSRFREACRTLVKTVSQERRESARAHAEAKTSTDGARRSLNAYQQTMVTGSQVSLRERLREAIRPTRHQVDVDLSDAHDIDRVVQLGQELATLIEPAVAAAEAYDAFVRAADKVEASSESLQAELVAAQAHADELSQLTTNVQRLAEAALDLLGERCPVCDQAIDVDDVRRKLHNDISSNQARVVDATEARNAVMQLSQRVNEAKVAEQARARAQQELDRRASDLSLALGKARHVAVSDDMHRREGWRALARRLEELRTALRRVYAEVRAESAADESRLTGALNAAVKAEDAARKALEAVESREKTAKRLEKAAQRAADMIVARQLHDLEPSFAEVFDRLDPHPTFSVLRARQDVYYNKNQIVPEVFDPHRGVAANPLLVYSEGQLNTVALSYFLGLALNAPRESLGFMVLDDPLQSMDVLAVLGFADLCRRLRRRRQLLITTHDRRYADLLGRKLTPRERSHRTITHEFDAWSPTGPRIKSRHREFEPTPAVL